MVVLHGQRPGAPRDHGAAGRPMSPPKNTSNGGTSSSSAADRAFHTRPPGDDMSLPWSFGEYRNLLRLNEMPLVLQGFAREKPEKLRYLGQQIDNDGHNLLHWAALFPEEVEVLQWCIERLHCNPAQFAVETKQTPLMWAITKVDPVRDSVEDATGRNTTTVFYGLRYLIQKGGKSVLRMRDSLGASALIIAVQHGNLPGFLLCLGQDIHCVDDTDAHQCTAAHWCSFRGESLMVKILIRLYGAKLFKRRDVQQMTPLHRSVIGGRYDIAKILLQENVVDYEAKSRSEETAFQIAARTDDYMMKLLRKEIDRLDDEKRMSWLGTGKAALMSNWRRFKLAMQERCGLVLLGRNSSGRGKDRSSSKGGSFETEMTNVDQNNANNSERISEKDSKDGRCRRRMKEKQEDDPFGSPSPKPSKETRAARNAIEQGVNLTDSVFASSAAASSLVSSAVAGRFAFLAPIALRAAGVLRKTETGRKVLAKCGQVYLKLYPPNPDAILEAMLSQKMPLRKPRLKFTELFIPAIVLSLSFVKIYWSRYQFCNVWGLPEENLCPGRSVGASAGVAELDAASAASAATTSPPISLHTTSILTADSRPDIIASIDAETTSFLLNPATIVTLPLFALARFLSNFSVAKVSSFFWWVVFGDVTNPTFFHSLMVLLDWIFLISYFKAWLSNPGAVKAFKNEKDQRTMICNYLAETHHLEKINLLTHFRLCETCFCIRDFRTKHCRVSGVCVHDFDHYCPWIGNAVGRGNHRSFMAFVTTLMVSLGMMFIRFIEFFYSCWFYPERFGIDFETFLKDEWDKNSISSSSNTRSLTFDAALALSTAAPGAPSGSAGQDVSLPIFTPAADEVVTTTPIVPTTSETGSTTPVEIVMPRRVWGQPSWFTRFAVYWTVGWFYTVEDPSKALQPIIIDSGATSAGGAAADVVGLGATVVPGAGNHAPAPPTSQIVITNTQQAPTSLTGKVIHFLLYHATDDHNFLGHCIVFLLDVVLFAWLIGLTLFQLKVVMDNMTTNEQLSAHKYPHLWKTIMVKTTARAGTMGQKKCCAHHDHGNDHAHDHEEEEDICVDEELENRMNGQGHHHHPSHPPPQRPRMQPRRVFSNAYNDKGSVMNNCRDFWFTRHDPVAQQDEPSNRLYRRILQQQGMLELTQAVTGGGLLASVLGSAAGATPSSSGTRARGIFATSNQGGQSNGGGDIEVD